jgi:predicted DNA-binding transcriptional regulator AlpA
MDQENMNQVTTKGSASSQTATVHGLSPNGHIRVKHQGQNYSVTGTLSERRPRTDGTGKLKWSRHLIASTPGYQESAYSDKSIVAHCPTTGKSYRVTGLFKKLNPKPILTNCHSEDVSASIECQSQNEKSESPLVVKVDGRIQRTQVAFQREFEVIAAQRAAGLDPDLRMSFIPAFLGESKASLYRKMGKGFPQPIKRGKGSFWPMSQIEAYKAGQLVGDVA